MRRFSTSINLTTVVAPNSRLRPDFRRQVPSPWLPQQRLWQVVGAAYVTLGVWHVLHHHVLMGVGCLAASMVASPRLRDMGRLLLSRGLRKLLAIVERRT